MNPEKTQFLNDVADHKMNIVMDNGVSRVVRFSRPDCDPLYWFDLITWPSVLCIHGDCGTYVFSRVRDMFEFFRSGCDDLKIKPSYWSEKLISSDRTCGFEEFSPDRFAQNVSDYFEQWRSDEIVGAGRRGDRIWKAIEEQVLSYRNDGEVRSYDAAANFSMDEFEFTDFWEWDSKVYTSQFIWCLYAIVWGIRQYDGRMCPGIKYQSAASGLWYDAPAAAGNICAIDIGGKVYKVTP